MKVINVLNKDYELIKNYKDAFNYEELVEKCTDYFAEYDYIFGDYAYNKIRLKGFCDSNNKLVNKVNNIDGLDEYIKNLCAYDCSYFLLKKIK